MSKLLNAWFREYQVRITSEPLFQQSEAVKFRRLDHNFTKLSQEQLAEYADYVTKMALEAKDPKPRLVLREQTRKVKPQSMSTANTTAWANAAAITRYFDDDDVWAQLEAFRPKETWQACNIF